MLRYPLLVIKRISCSGMKQPCIPPIQNGFLPKRTNWMEHFVACATLNGRM